MERSRGRPQTIHKQGYLFKQGTYFSTWNERYFSLQTSLLKQFTEADTAIPSYSIYLGSAAVDGLFSADSNDELGYGKIWTFVLRWPLPETTDFAIEQQWGFMHIGSYDRKEAEEWYDSIAALIRVEQTKRLMGGLVDARSGAVTPATQQEVRKLYFLNPALSKRVGAKFAPTLDLFVSDLNMSINRWTLVSVSDEGLLYRIAKGSADVWRFVACIPAKTSSAKRVWECLCSDSVAAWQPAVKNATAHITDQRFTHENDIDLVQDVWSVQASVEDPWSPVEEISESFDRVAFAAEDNSRFYLVALAQAGNPEIESVAWCIETVSSGSMTCITLQFTLSNSVRKLALSRFANVAPAETVADAVIRPAVVRPVEFILSQS